MKKNSKESLCIIKYIIGVFVIACAATGAIFIMITSVYQYTQSKRALDDYSDSFTAHIGNEPEQTVQPSDAIRYITLQEEKAILEKDYSLSFLCLMFSTFNTMILGIGLYIIATSAKKTGEIEKAGTFISKTSTECERIIRQDTALNEQVSITSFSTAFMYCSGIHDSIRCLLLNSQITENYQTQANNLSFELPRINEKMRIFLSWIQKASDQFDGLTEENKDLLRNEISVTLYDLDKLVLLVSNHSKMKNSVNVICSFASNQKEALESVMKIIDGANVAA